MLEDMITEKELNPDTHDEAQAILKGMLRFDFVCLLEYWEPVLWPIKKNPGKTSGLKNEFQRRADDFPCLQIQFLSERNALCNICNICQ